MATLFIPAPLRPLAEGAESFQLEGNTVGELVKELRQHHLPLAQTLCPDGEIKQGMVVAIDGAISNRGLYQKVNANSEVHFLPMVGGG